MKWYLALPCRWSRHTADCRGVCHYFTRANHRLAECALPNWRRAALHLLRMARWRGWLTLGVPLLWSMRLSYLYIPLALPGLGLSSDAAEAKNLAHLPAIASIRGMMSRVSLGHTGRPLDAPGYTAFAFGILFSAAVTRAFLPILNVNMTQFAWYGSATLWIIAFALFLVRYIPILIGPRADGKSV
jgi:uncharacterized protein involved in response to NO